MIHEELYRFDEECRAGLDGLLCGVDEAGRGPLAGPVVCAAVLLAPGARYDNLTDSKKISEKQRERLYDEIIDDCPAYMIIAIDSDVIDEINILAATMRGMRQCIEQLAPRPALALIDGNRLPDSGTPCRAVVKGDATSACIAAASVLAKVTRDRIMRGYGAVYPEYGFGKHKGYPTKDHYEAVRQYGLTAIHRRTFFYKNEDIMQRQDRGARGEAFAARYLRRQGYELLANNYRSRYGEIDLIAQKDGYIVFCEVKTRLPGALVSGAQSVDSHKQQRVVRTAALYLQQNESSAQPRFDVIEVLCDGDSYRIEAHHENAFDAQDMG